MCRFDSYRPCSFRRIARTSPADDGRFRADHRQRHEGEVIARKAGYGRQLGVRSARAAGASWAQIGAALGTTKQSAWEAYSRWVDQQVGS